MKLKGRINRQAATASFQGLGLAGRLAWLAFVWWLSALGCFGQTGTMREYELKQALLYRIIEYTEWPAGTLSNLPPVIQIGFVGNIPFVEALEVLNGKTIQNRKIVTKRISEGEHLDCHVLFIGASEKSRLAEILARLENRPILTVSEMDGFVQHGGMINVPVAGNQISLEINPQAVTRSGLNLGSPLLKAATKIVSR